MKLTNAQQKVIDHAKERIDYARTHSFCDWWRHNTSWWKYQEMSDEEVYTTIQKRTEEGWIGTLDYEIQHYQMNIDGIDYLCHASSTTIKKLEKLGLIRIIKDSNGERYGFDTIRLLNY